MDLDADLRLHLQGGLSRAGLLTPDLETMPTDELLLVYLNAASRLIPAGPRRVHRSSELDRTLKAADQRLHLAMDRIVADIEQGEPLGRYLSRAVEDAYVAPDRRPPTLKGRRDIDLMLSAWGVHHLHLGSKSGKGGKVKRTGALLFAAFRSNDAYLIDILDHQSFHKRQVLETIARNWPEAGLMHRSRFAIGLTQNYDEDVERDLREAGVAVAGVMIDGALWTPASVGQSMGGVSMVLVSMAQTLKWHLWWVGDQLEQDPKFLEHQFEGGVPFADQPDWHFVITPTCYGVHDRLTDATVILSERALPALP